MTDFRCLSCGLPRTRVTNVRTTGAYKIRRRRKCECGRSFATVEIPADDHLLLVADGGAISSLDKAVQRLHDIIAGIKARSRTK